MPRIILQPASLPDARKNYKKTVENSVHIDRIAKFLTREEDLKLRENYPDGMFKVWGALPGGGRVNYWNEISRGDVILFARDNFIFSAGVITTKFCNPDVANVLWGRNKKGQTWEYLYFIAELRPTTIPYLKFNQLLGYRDGAIIRSFRLLNEDQSVQLLEEFTYLESETYFDDSTFNNLEVTVNKLSKVNNTDRTQPVKVRIEQRIFRGWLFGENKYSTCGICHTEYPVAFLHAAHIRKRSECTHQQRVDPYVVMPMCRMGCDDLYERGYISVKDGKIVGLNQEHTTPAIEKAKDAVIGNQCRYYTDRTIEYFQWHFNSHGSNKS